MGVKASFKKSIKPGNTNPVYIFTGNDGYTKEEHEKKICDSLAQKYGDCDRHIFKGTEVAAGKIIDEARGSSLFASHKLIIIREANQLLKDKTFKKFIEEHAEKENCDCTIIAEYENTNYPKGGVRGLSKNIQQNFMLPYDNQMPSWVRRRFKNRGKKITDEAANFLIFCCSNNLFNMTKEIEKVLIAYPDKKKYGLKEIKSISSAHKKDNIFGYLDALTAKNEKKALLLLDNLIKYGSEPIYIVGMLKWKLQQLITVKKIMLKKNLSESKVLKEAGLNVYVNRGMCSLLKRYTLKKLLKAYDRLAETDVKMKSSGADNRLILEEYSLWFMTDY